MKLRLPNKLVAALLAAMSATVFTTLSTGSAAYASTTYDNLSTVDYFRTDANVYNTGSGTFYLETADSELNLTLTVNLSKLEDLQSVHDYGNAGYYGNFVTWTYNNAAKTTYGMADISSNYNGGNVVNYNGFTGLSSSGTPWTTAGGISVDTLRSYANGGDLVTLTISNAPAAGGVQVTALDSQGVAQTLYSGTGLKDSSCASAHVTAFTVNMGYVTSVTLNSTSTLSSVGFTPPIDYTQPFVSSRNDGTSVGRIMFLGDSITHGVQDMSWRWGLFKTFVDNGIENQIAGPRTTYNSTPLNADFDGTSASSNTSFYGGALFENRHYAEASGRTFNMLKGNPTGNVLGASKGVSYSNIGSDQVGQNYNADTYIMMMGTNDILSDGANTDAKMALVTDRLLGQGSLANGTWTNADVTSPLVGLPTNTTTNEAYLGKWGTMGKIIDNLNMDARDVMYVLSIPTWGQGRSDTQVYANFVPDYNTKLEAWTKAYSASHTGTVKYIDINRGLVDKTLNGTFLAPDAFFRTAGGDYIHPNEQGALIIAGNLAQGMGFAGRTAGLLRADSHTTDTEWFSGAASYTINAGDNVSVAENVFGVNNGYTVDFKATFGNGAEGDWLSKDNALSISVGDGANVGTLNLSEGYISWGSKLLFSQDNSLQNNDTIRIAYQVGDDATNVGSGYYVWLGDMLIGQALTAGSGSLNGITLSATGATGTVSGLTYSNTAYAPTTSLITSAENAFHVPAHLVMEDHNATATTSGIDWVSATTNTAQQGVTAASAFTDGIAKVKLTAVNNWFAAGAVTATGNIEAKVDGQTSRGNAFALQGGKLTGDVTMEFSDSTIASGSYSGQSAAVAGSFGGAQITGTFSAYIDNSTLQGDMVGGALSGTGSIGAVDFVVNSGMVQGSVYGGSKSGGAVGNGTADAEGNFSNTAVTITINGGTINGSVNGGGTNGLVKGNAEIVLNGGIIKGNVLGGDVQGASSVTVNSNKVSVGGNISADNVTLQNIAVTDYDDAFDKFSGTVTAADTLTLDHYTAAQVGSAVSAQHVVLKGNSSTTIRNLTLTACTITAQDGSDVTLTGTLTLGNTATYSGNVIVEDGITFSMGTVAAAKACGETGGFSDGNSGYFTMGTATLLTPSDASRLTVNDVRTYVGAGALANVTFAYDSETGKLTATSANPGNDGIYYVNDTVIYAPGKNVYAADHIAINDGGNLTLQSAIKSGTIVEAVAGSTTSAITVDNGVTLTKPTQITGDIASYVVNEGGLLDWTGSGNAGTGTLNLNDALSGTGTLKVVFGTDNHNGVVTTDSTKFTGIIDLNGYFNLKDTANANANATLFLHNNGQTWFKDGATIANNLIFGDTFTIRPSSGATFSGVLTSQEGDTAQNLILGHSGNQNQTIIFSNADAANINKVTLEYDNLKLTMADSSTAAGTGKTLYTGNVVVNAGRTLSLEPKAYSDNAVAEHQNAYQYNGSITFDGTSSATSLSQVEVNTQASVYVRDGLHFAQENGFATFTTKADRNQFINGLHGTNATLNLVRTSDTGDGSRAGYFWVENLDAHEFSGTINLKTVPNSNSRYLGGLIVRDSSDGLKNTVVNFESGAGQSLLAFIENLNSAQWDGTTENGWSRILKGWSGNSTFQDGEVLGLSGSKGIVYADHLSINNATAADYVYGGTLDIHSLTVSVAGSQQINGGSISGNVTVNGGTLKLGSHNALGAANAGTSRLITINEGGTIDINGQSYGTAYVYTLAGGSLVNNGRDTDAGHIQTVGLNLADDSAIGGTGAFYLLSSNWGATNVALNGHTLTKEGSNTVNFWSTSVTSGNGASGILRVEDGVLNIDRHDSTKTISSVDADIVVAKADSAAVTGYFTLAGGHTITSEVANGIISAAITTQGATTLSTMGEGSSLSLTGGLTVGGTLTNTGALSLSGTVAVNTDKLWNYEVKAPAEGNTYSDGDNGYLENATMYLVKSNGGTLESTASFTDKEVTNDGAGNLTFTATDTTTYYVNSGNLTYDDTQMGGASNLYIAKGAALTADGAPTDAKVLKGEGTFNLATVTSNADIVLPTNVTLSDTDWQGIVHLTSNGGGDNATHGVTNITEAQINALGNASSWVEFENFHGYLQNAAQTITANLILTGDSAISITADFDKTRTFTGDIKGSGNLVHTYAANTLQFSGDISGWTGAIQKGSNDTRSTTLNYSGKATDIETSINYTGTSGFNLTFGAITNGAEGFTFAESVKANLVTLSGQKVSFDGDTTLNQIATSSNNSTSTLGGSGDITIVGPSADAALKVATAGVTLNIEADNLTIRNSSYTGDGNETRKRSLAITGSGATVNINSGVTTVYGATYIGSNKATLNIGTGENAATLVTTRLEVGDAQGGSSTLDGDKLNYLNVGSKGKVVVTGAANNVGGDAYANSLLMGEWATASVANIEGKFYAKEAILSSHDYPLFLTIGDGGIMAVKGLDSNRTSSTAQPAFNLTLQDGGKLILGSEGLKAARALTPWTINLNGGEIGMTADMTMTRAMTLNGDVTFNTAKYTWSGEAAAQEVVAGTEGGTMTISNVLSGEGGLIKTGAGTLVLSGANTFTGDVNITGGTLKVNNNLALGAVDSSRSIVIGQGGVLDVNGRQVTDHDGYTVTLDGGTLTNSGGLTNENSAQLITGLILTDDSTILATSGHKFGITPHGEGSTSIDLGGHTLEKTGNGNFAVKKATITGGGTLKVTQSNLEFFDDVSLDADFVMNGGSVTANAGITLTDDISVTAEKSGGSFSAAIKTEGHTLTVGGTANLTMSGVISGNGSVTKTGADAITMTAANNYTGGTTIENGALILTNSNALSSSVVTFADRTAAQSPYRTLAFITGASYDGATGALTGGSPINGTIAGLSGYRGTVVADTLTINVAQGGDYQFLNRYDGTTTNDGAVLSVNKLVKQGAGTQVIGGEYTTGSGLAIANGVDVQGGTLHLKTRGIVTADFDVQAGATLKTTDDATNQVTAGDAVKYDGTMTLHGTEANTATLNYTDGSTYITEALAVDGYGKLNLTWGKLQYVQALTGTDATLTVDRNSGDANRGGYVNILSNGSYSGTINLITRAGNEMGGLIMHDAAAALADTVVNFGTTNDKSLVAFIAGDGTFNDNRVLTTDTFTNGSVGGLDGSKGSVKAAELTINTAEGGNYAYSGDLTVTDLVKSGAGSQSLAVTANLNSLDVQGGTLKVTGGALTVTEPITIGNGGTLSLNATSNGQQSFIHGSVSVGNGGKLVIAQHDATGYKGGDNSLHDIHVQTGGEMLLGFSNSNETFVGNLTLDGTLAMAEGFTGSRIDLFTDNGHSAKVMVSNGANGVVAEGVKLELRQNDSEFNIGTGGSLTVNGTITKTDSGAGNNSFRKTGEGTMIINTALDNGNGVNNINVEEGALTLNAGAKVTGKLTLDADATLNIGAQGNVVLNDADLGSVIHNEGTLTLNGNINVLQTLDTTNATFSEDTYGYLREARVQIADGGTVTAGENVSWSISGQSATSMGLTSSTFEGGTLTLSGEAGTMWYMNNTERAHTYNAEDTTTTAILINAKPQEGTNAVLTVDTNGAVPERLASVIVNDTTADLNLAQNTVFAASKLRLTNGGSAVLTGAGTFDLGTPVFSGNNLVMPSGVTVGDAEHWTGAVSISGSMSQWLNGASLDDLSNANSWVEFHGISGVFNSSQTVNANIRFTDNGGEAAFKTTGGFSSKTFTFNGKVSGTGTYYLQGYNNGTQTFAFNGDASAWTGTLKSSNTNATGNKIEISNAFGATLKNEAGNMQVTLSDAALAEDAFTGDLVVNAGTMNVNGALNSSQVDATVSGGTLNLNDGGTMGSISMTGGALNVKNDTNATTLTMTGSSTLNIAAEKRLALTAAATAGDKAYGGVTGSGTLAMNLTTGDNGVQTAVTLGSNFTGTLELTGHLRAESDLGGTSLVKFSGSGAGLVFTSRHSGEGMQHENPFARDIELADATTLSVATWGNSGNTDDNIISGAITGGSNTAIVKKDTGHLTISGDLSNFHGDVKAESGDLLITGAPESGYTLKSIHILGGNVNLAGGSYTIEGTNNERGLFTGNGKLTLESGASLLVNAHMSSNQDWQFEMQGGTNKGVAIEKGATFTLDTNHSGDSTRANVYNLAVAGVDAETPATITAAANRSYNINAENITIANADVTFSKETAGNFANKLENSSFTNAGSTAIALTNSESTLTALSAQAGNITAENGASFADQGGDRNNTSTLKSIKAEGGDIMLHLKTATSVSLNELVLKDGHKVSADTTTNTSPIAMLAEGDETPTYAANIKVGGVAGEQETAKFEADGVTTINANLTIAGNTQMVYGPGVTQGENGGVNLAGNSLTLSSEGGSIFLTNEMMATLSSTKHLTLFSNVGGLTLNGLDYTLAMEEANYNGDIVYIAPANRFFADAQQNPLLNQYTVAYNTVTKEVFLAPEPTTTALSLLALSALAARRKRK